ncbi:hypothetical protein [Flaviaesturariibacter terrae]
MNTTNNTTSTNSTTVNHVHAGTANTNPQQPVEKCYTVSRAFMFWAVGLGLPILAAAFWKMYDLGFDKGCIKFDKEKNELVGANFSLQRQFDLYRDSVSHANAIAAIADAITERGAIRYANEIALRKAINDAIHHH